MVFAIGPWYWGRLDRIESVVKQIGPERLLFGSDIYALWPSLRLPPVIIGTIKKSLLPENEKAAILGQNAVRLFGLSEGGIR